MPSHHLCKSRSLTLKFSTVHCSRYRHNPVSYSRTSFLLSSSQFRLSYTEITNKRTFQWLPTTNKVPLSNILHVHHRSNSQVERATALWDMPVSGKTEKRALGKTKQFLKLLLGKSTHNFLLHFFGQSMSLGQATYGGLWNKAQQQVSNNTINNKVIIQHYIYYTF